jgi:DNA-binding transcriptional ArsR family regulator
MTIRQIADRAGVSHPQAARHIRDLERLGIVDRELVGRSHLITLTDTMASELLRRLARLREDVIAEMRGAASKLDPQPFAMIVFGSFARGDDDAKSDIDVLVVVDGSAVDPGLDETLEEWCRHIAARTGNPVAEIVVLREDLGAMSPALLQHIRRDGILIAGAPIPDIPALRIVAEDGPSYGA